MMQHHVHLHILHQYSIIKYTEISHEKSIPPAKVSDDPINAQSDEVTTQDECVIMCICLCVHNGMRVCMSV